MIGASLVLLALLAALLLAGDAAADIRTGHPAGVDKELMLTHKEKIAFDKLKAAVYKNLTEEYMKQDLFLLRYIRAKNLDVERATNDVFSYIEFLRVNNIKNILKEDWSEYEQDYPFNSNITDRQGRPVAYGGLGTGGWNIRNGILQGKRSQLVRYVYKIAFELNYKLVDIQKQQPNITQFVLIMNMDGFNMVQHACPMCISTYMNLLQAYERFFPGFSYEIIVINAPQAYLILLDVLRQVLSKHTRDALKVYGTNRNNWKGRINELIDPNKLPVDFGGNILTE